jgi:hypothetical protein
MFKNHLRPRVLLAILLLGNISLSVGCFEKNTDDAKKAYKYWSGEKPPPNLRVINGHYWESAHWSTECVLYLEINAPQQWIEELMRTQNLEPSEENIHEMLYDNKPLWFKPNSRFKIYSPKGGLQNFTLYKDSTSGHIFIEDSI